jgi:glycosyltransferase involved in cell wall biosynthesis
MSAGSSESPLVLVVLHDDLMNGATISVVRAAELLRGRKWRFAFWVPRPGDAADHLTAAGYEVGGEWRPVASGLKALREPPGAARRLAATPGYMRAFRRFARGLKPDLVHSNSLYSFAEALSARRARLPTMLHVHDMAPGSRKAAVARAICRRGVDLTVAVSEACADSYAHAGWRPRVVYEAAPIPAEPAAVRERPEPFVVGTVGVISRRKGSDLFVAAAERLAGSGIAFRMIGAATDPLDRDWAAEVLRRAAAAGIEHVPRADVAAVLREWDAFVLPSRRDPCPISMLEAMATGLPVIGTRVDGLAEQITSESGILVAGDDPDGLAAAIRRLHEMPADVRRRLGSSARQRVADRFSLERQAEGLDRAYTDTMAAADT